MDNQNRKGALYQIVAFILAKLSTLILVKFTTLVLAKLATLVLAKLAALVFRRPESGLRYNFEMDLFG
ncbi:TPA: hypothetical protein ACU8BI_001164 [Neisseria subflava]